MRLAVNIDHVATLREARGEMQPDPVAAAVIAELAGAEGIVCHLREDRRHINDRDLRLLRETIKTRLDLEMAATDELLKIALETLPELATIVPERRQELTTEGGLDVLRYKRYLKGMIRELQRRDIQVSLFIDPLREQLDAARDVGANTVEIHTGAYARARTEEEIADRLEEIRTAARYAADLGLNVNAGHGLNYQNIRRIRGIEEVQEVSIGHAIIVRALFTGMEAAVREMVDLVR
jgi:pyridoxine 5-phosphate synthase